MSAPTSALVLGGFAVLLGIAGIIGALLRRRGRDRYPETYAESGGIIYTAASAGCGAVLLLGGLGLVIVALATKT